MIRTKNRAEALTDGQTTEPLTLLSRPLFEIEKEICKIVEFASIDKTHLNLRCDKRSIGHRNAQKTHILQLKWRQYRRILRQRKTILVRLKHCKDRKSS